METIIKFKMEVGKKTYLLFIDCDTNVVDVTLLKGKFVSVFCHNVSINEELSSKDYKEAFRLALRAAEQGYAQAERFVGACYEHGVGTEADRAVAEEWYARARAKGLEREGVIKTVHSVPFEPSQAVESVVETPLPAEETGTPAPAQE